MSKMTYFSIDFQKQLQSILDALTKDAITEIGKLIEDGSALLRLEIHRSHEENETLKRKLQVLESQLMAADGHRQTRAGPCENASGTKHCLTVEKEDFSGLVLVGEESNEQKETWSESLIKTERLEEECGGEGERADEPIAAEWGSSLNQDTPTEAQSTPAEDTKQLSEVETIVLFLSERKLASSSHALKRVNQGQ
ncbi:hypothetical protein MATL_G00159110 [Megalops atlanticus]|uniref:Uncharacterized protein n=1 Tax=Megalops atlanticus TaxID=7932 RepID=A0A9D3PQ69_MEGAT|nr:hypothetical protein MATL_G00159110 [Megalops atlanticus]